MTVVGVARPTTMGAARAYRLTEAPRRSMVPVTATAALIVLVVAFTQIGVSPRWQLAVAIVLLSLSLIAGSVLRRLADPGPTALSQTVLSLAALAVVALCVPSGIDATRWPELATAAVLSAGLLWDRFAVLLTRRAHRDAVRLAVTVAALIVLVVAMSRPHLLPHWQLRAGALVLGAGPVIGEVAYRVAGRSASALVQTVVWVAALAVLLLFLPGREITDVDGAGFYDTIFMTRWPELTTAGILAGGLLLTGPLAGLGTRSREHALADRVDELSRTRRGALDVQASELRRIERDLHDGAQARLVALSMRLGRAEERFRDEAEMAVVLREAREDASAAIRELRELARGIAPPVLTDRGLDAAVRSLAQRSGAEVDVRCGLTRRPPPAVETAAYFVVAESITNALKHAAGARIEVHLDERAGELFVEVTDFGPGDADRAGAGLTGLRQRVEALDGTLHVTSPPGVGTQVEAVLPCVR